jgi:hypothetical protein
MEIKTMRSKLASTAAALAALCIAGNASALTVPFTEDFTSDVSGWEDAGNAPLTWNAAGGPGGSSYASTEFSYFGFSNPFGGGPVMFRGSQGDNASGGAFVGDWIAGGVAAVTAWVYQETGVPLTFFVRVATNFNFPGAVINDDVAVPSGVWTQIAIPIETTVPPCNEETVPCAQSFATVGNIQFGTNAPSALTGLDESFVLAIDQVSLVAVPEPGTTALLGAGLLALAASGHKRRQA